MPADQSVLRVPYFSPSKLVYSKMIKIHYYPLIKVNPAEQSLLIL